MDIYSIFKPCLFKMDAEQAHDFTLKQLRRAHQLGLTKLLPSTPLCQPRKQMGITFPNPIGLAAGLDKNGTCIDGLAALGFGFIEIGTITPRPQPGNPKPRLFRLPEANAIINRFGFNNHGVDQLIENVKSARYQGVLGINIGKNADTPIERAVDDYLICLEKVYPHADYITVNISSPNTKNLRSLQEGDSLNALLQSIKESQTTLTQQHGQYVPIALKIAPDLDSAQIQAIADLLRRNQFDGVIATNTTLSREAVKGMPHADEAGGLSGAPVNQASTKVIAELSRCLQGEIPIIGVGGILSGSDAQAKIEAGASLVQVYSGLIYRGPTLIKEICTALG